jgi:hypothetical protein
VPSSISCFAAVCGNATEPICANFNEKEVKDDQPTNEHAASSPVLIDSPSESLDCENSTIRELSCPER